jgi:hypothetical protein
MTSNLSMVRFQASHLALLGGLSDSMVGMGMLHKEVFYGHTLEGSGPAFSVFKGKELIGCGGIGLYWSGVGEAWLILSDKVSQYPFSLHRIVCKALEDIIREEHLHRVQTVVPYGHARARKWIERLGFEYEGMMPKYGPDASWFLRYGRIT